MLIFVLESYPLVAEMITMLIHSIRPEARVMVVNSFKQLNSLIDKYQTPDYVMLAQPESEEFNLPSVVRITKRLPHGNIILMVDGKLKSYSTDHDHHANESAYIISKRDRVESIYLKLVNILRMGKGNDKNNDEEIEYIEISRRHRQLVNFLNQGYSNKQIALQLGICEQTVKVHFFRLYKKLGVNNRIQALNYAKSKGWISNFTPT